MSDEKQTGRPKEENPRDVVVRFRLTREEAALVDEEAKLYGLSRNTTARTVMLRALRARQGQR